MMFGLFGMVFALSSSMQMINKIPITIFCFVLIIIGVVVENPIIMDLITPKDSEETYK